MESPVFATSNTYVSYLKIKVGRKCVLHYFGEKSLRKSLSSFLIVILFEEYTSGERRKEMHVHIDGKEIEKILSHIKIRVGV